MTTTTEQIAAQLDATYSAEQLDAIRANRRDERLAERLAAGNFQS